MTDTNKILSKLKGKDLSRREIDILQYVSNGWTYEEIQEVLFIEYGTIRSHVTRIRAKLDARDKTHAVAIAIRKGWIE